MTTYGKKADKFEVYRAIYNAPAGTSMRDIAKSFDLTKARVSQIKKEIEDQINANDQTVINKLKDLGITLDTIATHKIKEKEVKSDETGEKKTKKKKEDEKIKETKKEVKD